jgi:hypothetical protein
MSDIVDALRRERQELEAELWRDPRYRRIKLIDDLLATYPTAAGGAPTLPPATKPKSFMAGGSGKRPPSKADIVRAEVREFLKNRGPTHRSEILAHITAKGLMGHEKKPMANLATFLSESKGMFAFDGKGNWCVADNGAEPGTDKKAGENSQPGTH